jgi:hypothetical protein
MTQISSKHTGIAWRLFCAAVVPFLVLAAYLFLTRWPSHRYTTVADYSALAGSVLVGVAFIATLPIRPMWRVLLPLVYIPVIGFLLCFFTVWFIVAVFNDGL